MTGTVLFYGSGQLDLNAGISFGIPCAIGALFGSRFINEYIKRTKKLSVLLFMLFGCLVLTFIISSLTSYNKIIEASNKDGGLNIFHLNSYCN